MSKAPTRSGRTLRCAVYTRKSSEEGLEQEFNSLHAQSEACEAFIRSQHHEGWSCLPQAYDDGGRSGGKLERPALQQLLADNCPGSAGFDEDGACHRPMSSASGSMPDRDIPALRCAHPTPWPALSPSR